MALTKQAKPYRLGTSVDGIFTALRARFGISAVDARVCLQGLRREARTPLQDHATTMKRLAQIAYSDLPEVHRERYTYDTFVQSLKDLGLRHQLQARGVTTIKGALREGETYLLAKQLRRAHVSFKKSRWNLGQVTMSRRLQLRWLSPPPLLPWRRRWIVWQRCWRSWWRS